MRARSCLSLALFLVACGDRTGLLVPDERGGSSGSASSGSASPGTGDDGGTQVEPDAEVVEDALPPLDVTVPQDAFNDCPNANSTFIYVVTQQSKLLSFYPPTAQFQSIGTLNCPTTGSAPSPFSMAVDRTGIAYVLFGENPDSNGKFQKGELFRVSTATASCRATGFTSRQGGFSPVFGMGYSRDDQTGAETLYLASAEDQQSTLATVDTASFALKVVGPFTSSIQNAELTGTGAGDLFAFFEPNTTANMTSAASIGQIDKPSGKLTNESMLKGIQQGFGWAFAFWGGDFYTFTAPARQTVVTRFRPTDQTLVTVAKRSDVVVGAGVSTCAPAQ